MGFQRFYALNKFRFASLKDARHSFRQLSEREKVPFYTDFEKKKKNNKNKQQVVKITKKVKVKKPALPLPFWLARRILLLLVEPNDYNDKIDVQPERLFWLLALLSRSWLDVCRRYFYGELCRRENSTSQPFTFGENVAVVNERADLVLMRKLFSAFSINYGYRGLGLSKYDALKRLIKPSGPRSFSSSYDSDLTAIGDDLVRQFHWRTIRICILNDEQVIRLPQFFALCRILSKQFKNSKGCFRNRLKMFIRWLILKAASDISLLSHSCSEHSLDDELKTMIKLVFTHTPSSLRPLPSNERNNNFSFNSYDTKAYQPSSIVEARSFEACSFLFALACREESFDLVNWIYDVLFDIEKMGRDWWNGVFATVWLSCARWNQINLAAFLQKEFDYQQPRFVLPVELQTRQYYGRHQEEWCSLQFDCYTKAISKGDRETLLWLFDNYPGPACPFALNDYNLNNPHQFSHDHCRPSYWCEQLCVRACLSNRIPIIQLVFERQFSRLNNYESMRQTVDRCLFAAVRFGKRLVYEWLVSNRDLFGSLINDQNIPINVNNNQNNGELLHSFTERQPHRVANWLLLDVQENFIKKYS